MQKMSECKKCKNPGVDNAQTNFRMWLNDNKSAHIPLKLINEELRIYFKNIMYKRIMKIKTIGNLQYLTNLLLMSNQEKKKLIGSITLHHFFLTQFTLICKNYRN